MPVCASRHAPRNGLTGADGEELVAQRLELVAQLRGVLEAQLLGGREHLLLERDDELLDLLARHALDLARRAPATRHVRRVAEREQLEDVGDALHDRGRRYAVLLVVGELDRTPAPGLVDRPGDRLR